MPALCVHLLILQEKSIMMRLATEKAEINRLRRTGREEAERKRKVGMVPT